MKFEPEQLIDNRYQIIEKIGQGGMGSVWKAIDQQLNDEVVIKMPLVNSEPALLQRFATEAQTMRKHSLGNPNIIDIQGVGTVDGTPYYVMRFLPGGSLEDRCPLVDSADTSKFKIETFEWLLSIGKALDYLHDNGVLHRDVKPANILFNQSGDAYLADFGIAKNPTDVTNFTQHVTATGTSPGTFGYMAPEVLNPEPNMPIGGAVDQYALAVTLHEAIAGKRPYDSTNVVKLYLLTQAGCPPLRDSFPHLPVGASDAVARALSNDPAKRFDSCRSFADAFLNGLRSNAKVSPEVVDAAPELDHEERPSEAPTGMVDIGRSTVQGGSIHGGETVAPPQPNIPSSGSSKFAKKPNKPVQSQKTTAPANSGVPWGPVIAVLLALLGLVGGGLAFSGAFSGNKPDEQQVGSRDSSDGGSLKSDSSKDSPKNQPRPASFKLAQRLFSGTGGERQNQPRAISMFEKLARNGSLESQKRLAEIYLNAEDGDVDFEEVFKWMLMAAEQGDAESQMAVGASYSTGDRGVDRDLSEAVKWLRKSAEQGLGPAQVMLGFHYSRGLGVDEDLHEAKRWLERAKSAGESEAEQLLAGLEARSVTELSGKEYTQSPLSLVEAHAELGFADAEYELGRRANESGDYKTALYWYRKAAEQGSAER